jgi:RNA polymerase sigma factor (sigma-70 family)
MSEIDIVPHLFRTEFSKIVAVLTQSFGLDHIEVAEDIAGETFLLALDTWPYKGKPANPTAWLYTVAKNKVKNHLARQQNFETNIAEKLTDNHQPNEIAINFSDQQIADSQLRMLFTVCHPSISTSAQICLALRILCGLGLNEIADAFLTNTETIHKRLQRAKEKLKAAKLQVEIPDPNTINQRLDTVLHTLYLLFSEGYYSESNNSVIREELCIEALNLNYLLLNNPSTNNHATNALMSLMCFQSSRLKARQAANGEMVLYDHQDPNLWDTEFIEKGFYYLQQASKWPVTSTYYIEASIAYWHTVPNSHADKWSSIVGLYDALVAVDRSPIVGLNRIWAYAKVNGNQKAITEAEKLNLTNNHFYWMLLAELYKQLDTSKAMEHYQQAYNLSKTEPEKMEIIKQIDAIKKRMG